MSYNGPPPPYSEATAIPKPKTGVMPGHVMQTPLGPIQPHVDAMKPAPGEFMSSMVNPYASPKQRPNPNTNASYPAEEKVPYSQTSQLESGPYPGGTLQYSRNVGSDTASYQSPPNSILGNGPPPQYQSMPSPRMPIGSGATPGGIYPSVGGYTRPPYPTDTFERGMNQPGAPQGYPMPRPSNYTRDSSPPRIDQMNISGSPNNYPPGSRSYSPYSTYSTYPPNIGGGASYQSPPNSSIGSGTASYQSPPNSNIGSGTSYQNSPSPMIGSGAPRGYPSPPIGRGTSQGYSSPMIGSGTRGYSPPTAGRYPPPGPYSSTPPYASRSSNYLPARPVIGGPPLVGGYGSGIMGHSSGSCTSMPSSGHCSTYPSSNYCHTKRKNSSSSSSSTSTDSSISAHHSHHHHHHC